jgi:hypothetical protein
MRKPANGFKPGQSGNPNGRPVLAPEVVALRRLTQQDVAEIGQLIIMGDLQSLQDVMDRAQKKETPPDQRPTVLQVMIASGAIQAIKKGDVTMLNALLDRFVGRIPAALLVTGLSTRNAASEAKTIVFETIDVTPRN